MVTQPADQRWFGVGQGGWGPEGSPRADRCSLLGLSHFKTSSRGCRGPSYGSLWSVCCAGRFGANATKVDRVIPLRTSPQCAVEWSVELSV
ncbi:hypothetical protein NN561_004618 [Cricetulus griseus]